MRALTIALCLLAGPALADGLGIRDGKIRLLIRSNTLKLWFSK